MVPHAARIRAPLVLRKILKTRFREALAPARTGANREWPNLAGIESRQRTAAVYGPKKRALTTLSSAALSDWSNSWNWPRSGQESDSL